jgi:hypothetical protein
VSDSAPPPPDRDLAAALATLRGIDPAPAEVRARARTRLWSALGAGVPAGGSGGAAGAPRDAAARRALGGKAAVATVAFLAGGLAGAALYAVIARPPERIVYVDRVVPPPDVSNALIPVPAAPTPMPSAPTNALPNVPAATPPPSTRTSQLSAERVMLDEARAALAQGEPDRALERLERHRRTFSNPILGEERDAMHAEALAKAGRRDEAVAAAAAFHKRWPESLFASAVDAAVDSVR